MLAFCHGPRGRKTHTRIRFDGGTQRAQGIALAALALLGSMGTARAFVPSPEHDALEIPLPFQLGNLVYGDEVTSLTVPPVDASIENQIGGQWSIHSWNRQSGSPHYIVGSGADVAPALADPSDAESAAHHVLLENADALRLNLDQLRLRTVREGADKFSVHYQQTYEGLDVIGGRAHATFLNTGRVFVLGSDFFPMEGLNVTPRISQAEAERMAIDALPHDQRSVSTEPEEGTGLYVLPYPTSLESFEPRLVWKVTVVTDGRTGVFHTHLDADTGEILWRYNDVHYLTYFGHNEGTVNHTTYCNGETNQRLKYMEVVVAGAGTTHTDGNGDWVIGNADNPRPVTSRFFGPFVDVNRATGGSDATLTGVATPDDDFVFPWSDSNCRQDERDVFDAVVDIHDFFETVDAGYSLSNARMTANVGVPGSCNAFWNGTINFYDEVGGCANTGEVQSVVHHEFGHGVQHNLIGGQGDEGLGEGNSDILANFMTDESAIGRGFYLNACEGGIRDSDNDQQYPEDLGGSHHSGQIIAGVMWDARMNLESSLGSGAGKAQAARIWHFGRKLEMPTNQPDQVLSMFIADDNNGNLMDGTPNYAALCPAVVAHDIDHDAFDCADPTAVWVDFSYVGSENGSRERPYNSIFQAHSAAPVGYIMKVIPGSSTEVGILSKRGEIRKMGSGVVRIGAP